MPSGGVRVRGDSDSITGVKGTPELNLNNWNFSRGDPDLRVLPERRGPKDRRCRPFTTPTRRGRPEFRPSQSSYSGYEFGHSPVLPSVCRYVSEGISKEVDDTTRSGMRSGDLWTGRPRMTECPPCLCVPRRSYPPLTLIPH